MLAVGASFVAVVESIVLSIYVIDARRASDGISIDCVICFRVEINFFLLLRSTRTQGKADTINLEQLITFLNDKQRDPTLNEILYPLYDEKRASEIINDYEQNEAARNQSMDTIVVS